MIFAQKPPMGWNAWNYFGYADINERVVRETADAMAEQGFRDAGYVMKTAILWRIRNGFLPE